MKKKNLILIITLFTSFNLLAQTSRPIVSNINAFPKSSKSVKLTWTKPQNSIPEIQGFYIFRDSKQITSLNQISKLSPIAKLEVDAQEYEDLLDNSKEYYYCVLCNTSNGIYKTILPSVNSTIIGVRIASNYQTEEIITPIEEKKIQNTFQDDSEKMRDIPLPIPGLIEISNNTNNILGDKAMDVANDLGRKKTGNKTRITKMYVFEEDLISPVAGDEYYLFNILKNSFVKNNFTKAINELTDFLSIYRNDSVTKRATFYLGESYYFAKNYKMAVFQFLQVQDKYPELAKKWIDSSLDLIEIK